MLFEFPERVAPFGSITRDTRPHPYQIGDIVEVYAPIGPIARPKWYLARVDNILFRPALLVVSFPYDYLTPRDGGPRY